MEVMFPPPLDAPGGGGRRSSDSSSPDFEFWMVGNPSFPQPHLLSADELFVDGIILPLHLLSHQRNPEPYSDQPEADPEPEPPAPSTTTTAAEPAAAVSSSSSSSSSSSKRWKDIFRVAGGEKRAEEKERRKERKNSAGGAAELNININIWPFSRSRSAGNGGARPKGAASAASGRKVSSAPCSRSNSRGESSKPPPTAPTRRWASSPGRSGLPAGGGVHVGRTSPVWQARRSAKKVPEQPKDGAAGSSSSTITGNGGGRKGGVGGARVLNLNVNTCIGHGHQQSCRGEDNDGFTGGDRTASNNNGNGSHFNLRTLFSKKVY